MQSSRVKVGEPHRMRAVISNCLHVRPKPGIYPDVSESRFGNIGSTDEDVLVFTPNYLNFADGNEPLWFVFLPEAVVSRMTVRSIQLPAGEGCPGWSGTARRSTR